jgi:hypothetical protein
MIPSDPANTEQSKAVHEALENQDPLKLVRSLSADEIGRLELAEKVLELEHNRRKRTSPLSSVVSLVAFGGLAVNAFQSYSAGKTQERLREADQGRWEKEFERAKAADRYNAFLATSALATDNSNADKRLVGYALLEEFVDDKDYNAKSTLMLEQALFDELDRDDVEGLSEEHRNSVTAILSALSGTEDCGALSRAVRSIGRIAKRRAKTNDVAEAQEVFDLYVRRLYGRAAIICKTPEDFRQVEKTLSESLVKAPELGGLPPKLKLTPADANLRLTTLLIEDCKSELQITEVGDCTDVLRSFDGMCQRGLAGGDGASSCQAVRSAVATLPVVAVTKAERPRAASSGESR